MFKSEIEKFCNTIGLDTIGFIPCREFKELEEFYQNRQETNRQNEFEEQDIKKRINPNHYMEQGKTIISIAFPYYDKKDVTRDNGFSVYTKRLDYHRVVKKYLNRICEYIESLGGQAIGFVDSNTLPERYIAYLAGVGFIGKNNMIITKHYGSYVFLGEIITDLKIECQDKKSFEEVTQYIECGECEKCIYSCPTKSINSSKINPNICLSYLTQKKELNDREIQLLKGNIFGCDFCQLGCPYNETGKIALEEFKEIEDMNSEPDIYAKMDNKYFKEKVSQTSCGWRGKNIIKRNAIIRMQRDGAEIEQFKGDSPYLNEYIERLKKNR
ncbi:MAG: tRNA epoxyqueuosine(34) reductase QueG [Cellulosilyticaceae bacterium]